MIYFLSYLHYQKAVVNPKQATSMNMADVMKADVMKLLRKSDGSTPPPTTAEIRRMIVTLTLIVELALNIFDGMQDTQYASNLQSIWEDGVRHVHCSGFIGRLLSPRAMDVLRDVDVPAWIRQTAAWAAGEYSEYCCAATYAEAAWAMKESVQPLLNKFFTVAELDALLPGDIVARSNRTSAKITGHVWLVLTLPDTNGIYWAMHSADKPSSGIQMSRFSTHGAFGMRPPHGCIVGVLRPKEPAFPQNSVSFHQDSVERTFPQRALPQRAPSSLRLNGNNLTTTLREERLAAARASLRLYTARVDRTQTQRFSQTQRFTLDD